MRTNLTYSRKTFTREARSTLQSGQTSLETFRCLNHLVAWPTSVAACLILRTSTSPHPLAFDQGKIGHRDGNEMEYHLVESKQQSQGWSGVTKCDNLEMLEKV